MKHRFYSLNRGIRYIHVRYNGSLLYNICTFTSIEVAVDKYTNFY